MVRYDPMETSSDMKDLNIKSEKSAFISTLNISRTFNRIISNHNTLPISFPSSLQWSHPSQHLSNFKNQYLFHVKGLTWEYQKSSQKTRENGLKNWQPTSPKPATHQQMILHKKNHHPDHTGIHLWAHYRKKIGYKCLFIIRVRRNAFLKRFLSSLDVLSNIMQSHKE